MEKIVKIAFKIGFWSLYSLWMFMCIVGTSFHPVHLGMTEDESKLLCWKALFAGPYAGRLLPCIPCRHATVGIIDIAFPAAIILSAVALAAFRKWRFAAYAFALFVAIWFSISASYLGYWK